MPNHITNEISIKGSRKNVARAVKALIGPNGIFDFNAIIKMPESLMIDASSIVEDFAAALRNEVPRFFSIHHPDVKTAAEAMQILKERHKGENLERCLHQARLYNANIKKYGYPTWYEWSYDNWGTKWNAYNQFCELDAVQKAIDDDASYDFKEKRRSHKSSAYKKRLIKKRIQREIVKDMMINLIKSDEMMGIKRESYDLVSIDLTFDTAWAAPHPVVEKFAAHFPSVEITHKYADEDIGSNCGTVEYKDGEIFSQDIADNWTAMSKEERRKWTQFAIELKYGDVDPTEYGYDENWDYVEEED